MKKWIVILVVIAAVAGIGGYAYWNYRRAQEMLHPKFYSGNGRLEATEIYVSSKLAGRIEKIFVKEGDLVKKGDMSGEVSTWAMNPITGAFSQPGVAGTVPIT